MGKASPVTSFFTISRLLSFPSPSSRMYAQIPHLRNLRKHHPFPFFKCPLIYLLTSVFDFVTQSGVLIWKQMMLHDVSP